MKLFKGYTKINKMIHDELLWRFSISVIFIVGGSIPLLFNDYNGMLFVVLGLVMLLSSVVSYASRIYHSTESKPKDDDETL